MTVQTALAERYSARAFTAQEPDPQLVQRMLEQAAQSPSAGNLQPWQVIALRGAALQELIDAVRGDTPQDDALTASYPADLWEPYRTRRFQVGEGMYGALGIGHDDAQARQAQAAQNFSFFGAPVGILICADRRMQPAQWLDVGIYLQSLMLLATENGLATCAQGFWRRMQAGVKPFLHLPESYMVICGVALGYADASAPINQWRTSRAEPGDWLQLRGFAPGA
ncbi:nitroreductase [Allofranklinella schreckenbergeri]|uniref:Nitroreductase n=1 Tax=Allofranklinella schreckenbergeri TaxID=1076744 RepID=A0A3M6Q177_9BURK|nr:nitroreductase [Allofranklinella schreckenbergeri]RMW97029.1 nitroreductase [Allofranklinella schreckenbergeri]